MKKTLFCILAVFLAQNIQAGDDPSIKGKLREDIKKAMSLHIDRSLLNEKYVIYDAVEGKLLRLKFQELHGGIVRKNEFFVSCADFTDDSGTLYDLDFLVAEKQKGKLEVIQSIVHSVNKKKRKYHVE